MILPVICNAHNYLVDLTPVSDIDSANVIGHLSAHFCCHSYHTVEEIDVKNFLLSFLKKGLHRHKKPTMHFSSHLL